MLRTSALPVVADTYELLVKERAQPGGVGLSRRDIRQPSAGEALVRVRYAAICGTDLGIINWSPWAASAYKPPFALGHELSGDVLAVGDGVQGTAPGDRVSMETHLPCGRCTQCAMGRGHTCLNLRVFSRLDQGAFAEYAVVPAELLRVVPATLPHRHACLMEPLGIAVRAVIESGAGKGSLLVSGCGPIGLLCIAAAKALGVTHVAATDLSDARLKLARQLGADLALDPRDVEATSALAASAPEGGFDAAVEASGSGAAISAMLALTRPGGTVVLAGLPHHAVEIDLARHVVLREVNLRGIYGRRINETWQEVEALLPRLAQALDQIITHEFRLADFEQAFEVALSGQAGKVQFRLD